MNRIDDERVRFYLKHQELIDTWAAVRSDAREAAHDFYMSVSERLRDLASSETDTDVWVDEGTYSKIGLYRDSWKVGDGTVEPTAIVCLEWHKDATFIDGTRHIGIRVPYGSDNGKNLRPHIGDAVRGVRAQAGFGRSTTYWPAYQSAPSAEGEYWDALDEYGDRLFGILETAWETFAQPIHGAIDKMSNSDSVR